jgi:hypothetical protein
MTGPLKNDRNMAGLLSFVMTGMTLSWLILGFVEAGVVTFVMVVTLTVLAKTTLRVRKVFYLPNQVIVALPADGNIYRRMADHGNYDSYRRAANVEESNSRKILRYGSFDLERPIIESADRIWTGF